MSFSLFWLLLVEGAFFLVWMFLAVGAFLLVLSFFSAEDNAEDPLDLIFATFFTDIAALLACVSD